MEYKGLNILTGVPSDVEACKLFIDDMQVNFYHQYEILAAVSAHKGEVYYADHLSEHEGMWILYVTGKAYSTVELLEAAIERNLVSGLTSLPPVKEVASDGVKRAVITFSQVPAADNGFGLFDYVENVTSITQVVEVLANYYSPADMALIVSIEIVTE